MSHKDDTFDLKAYLEEKKRIVDNALTDFLQRLQRHAQGDKVSGPQDRILVDAMTYSVKAGGKRLRPILCLAACEAVGGGDEDAISASCALECIHTYSLIHDDLPAMDDDDLRRGKPTCHKKYGEAVAILAGDGLLTAAFQVLATDAVGVNNPSTTLQVIRTIAEAAGTSGMVQGQILDLSFEGKSVTWDEAQRMHRLKTGAMITASLESGAILGGGDARQIAALQSFGRHIGLAFQVADDILNVEGVSEVLGKPVGSDKALAKATAPAVLGMADAKRYAETLVHDAIKELRGFQEKGRPLAALARYVIERKK